MLNFWGQKSAFFKTWLEQKRCLRPMLYFRINAFSKTPIQKRPKNVRFTIVVRAKTLILVEAWTQKSHYNPRFKWRHINAFSRFHLSSNNSPELKHSENSETLPFFGKTYRLLLEGSMKQLLPVNGVFGSGVLNQRFQKRPSQNKHERRPKNVRFTIVVRAKNADSGGSMNAKITYNHVLKWRHIKRLFRFTWARNNSLN